jgi:hypothetical protein
LLLAIAAACTYWILQWVTVRSSSETLVPVPVGDRVARSQPLDTAAAASVFGDVPSGTPKANKALPTLSIRIRLDGVIAEGGQGTGIALISVDDRPALAYRVGDRIGATLTLTDVRADRIVVRTPQGKREVQMPPRVAPGGIVPAR